jgi:hypothetical protein
VSRTLQEQLAQIASARPTEPITLNAVSRDAPPREKSDLRRMADRAGFDPSVRVSPEAAIGAMLGKWSDWYLTNLQELKGKK